MSKYLTKSVAATISALLLLGCAAPAFAADATVEKKETSYLILNADGSVQEQITSDWLHSDDGFDAVTDESGLSDIQNLKSDVMPEQSGNTLKWTTDETDIYYQGKNSAQRRSVFPSSIRWTARRLRPMNSRVRAATLSQPLS